MTQRIKLLSSDEVEQLKTESHRVLDVQMSWERKTALGRGTRNELVCTLHSQSEPVVLEFDEPLLVQVGQEILRRLRPTPEDRMIVLLEQIASQCPSSQ